MTLFPEISDSPKTKTFKIPSYRIKLVKEATENYNTCVIRSPGDAAEILMKHYEEADREIFTILMLNIKHKVIGIHDVSVGSLTASVVHPREVFKAACLANAAALIIAHNHPSGDPQPSKEDLNITRTLIEAGKLMDIPIIDHIIIGDGNFISFTQEGHIQ